MPYTRWRCWMVRGPSVVKLFQQTKFRKGYGCHDRSNWEKHWGGFGSSVWFCLFENIYSWDNFWGVYNCIYLCRYTVALFGACHLPMTFHPFVCCLSLLVSKIKSCTTCLVFFWIVPTIAPGTSCKTLPSNWRRRPQRANLSSHKRNPRIVVNCHLEVCTCNLVNVYFRLRNQDVPLDMLVGEGNFFSFHPIWSVYTPKN